MTAMPPHQHDHDHEPAVSPARAGLMMLVLTVLAYSLLPFVPTRDPEMLVTRVARFFYFWNAGLGVVDLAFHLCFFGSMGFMLVTVQQRTNLRAALCHALIVVGGFALFIEVFQIFLPRRHANVVDLATNVAAATAGAAASWYSYDLQRRSRDWYRRHERTILRAVFCIAAIVVISLMVIPSHSLVSLETWDRSYPMLVGDEATGHRPWLGEIRWIAFYDRALNGDQVEGCFDTVNDSSRISVRKSMGLAGAYDFSDGSGNLVRGIGPPGLPLLSIQHPDRCQWLTGRGGLLIREPTKIVCETAPVQLADAIVATGSFSVEAWVRPGNLKQTGPARIVTFSRDAGNRNFTLGQEGDALQFRVRNQISGRNGFRPNLQSPPTLLKDKLVHIVATYDEGVSRLFVDGVKCGLLDHRSLAAVLRLTGSRLSELAAWLLCVWPLAVSGFGLRRKEGTEARRHGGTEGGVSPARCWVAVAFAILVVVLVGFLIHRLFFEVPLELSLFAFAAAALAVSIPLVHLCCANRRCREDGLIDGDR